MIDRQEIERRTCGGELYCCGDEQLICLDQVFAYSHLSSSRKGEKRALLREMFAEIGDGGYLEAPVCAEWGGCHVHFGNRVFDGRDHKAELPEEEER